MNIAALITAYADCIIIRAQWNRERLLPQAILLKAGNFKYAYCVKSDQHDRRRRQTAFARQLNGSAASLGSTRGGMVPSQGEKLSSLLNERKNFSKKCSKRVTGIFIFPDGGLRCAIAFSAAGRPGGWYKQVPVGIHILIS
ncbi:hypothetical protein IM543_14505 [Massilia sp. UMI-21]|nr:hypothetical protein IM543_14505 [Massilia sp. UMI-21]